MHITRFAAPLLLLATVAMVAGSGFDTETCHASGGMASSPATGMSGTFSPVTCGMQAGQCFLNDNRTLSIRWGLRSASGGGETSLQGSPAAEDADKLIVHRDIDDPDGALVVVNKQRPLAPITHVPGDLVAVDGLLLRGDTAVSFGKLREAAASDGVAMTAVSGYRSYENQAELYAGYAARYGQDTADTISARPGHSEHQTGLAVDIAAPDGTCSLQTCFEDTPAGAWVAANAYRFGFIVRYPEGQSTTTGYAYEPWHLRYVGADIAVGMHLEGTAALEDHLGLPAAENY